jgi:hypothetical protein
MRRSTVLSLPLQKGFPGSAALIPLSMSIEGIVEKILSITFKFLKIKIKDF